MRFESLEYFLEAARHHSFTEAARNLYVSQQGLSKSIKTLEKELGCRLFKKDGKTLKLTGAGRALMPYAKQCLNDLALLHEAMEPFSKMSAPGRGASDSGPALHATAFVSDSLFTLLDSALCDAQLDQASIIEHSYSEIVSELETGTTTSVYALSFPIAELVDILAIEHIVFRPLFKTQIMLAGSSQFVHPEKGAFTLDRISKLPVVYYNDPVLNWIIRDMFRDHPLQNVLTHASNPTRIRDFVVQGKAVTFSDSLSVYLTQSDEKLAYARIEGAAEFVTGFAYLDNTDVSPSSLAYMHAFEECFAARCADFLEDGGTIELPDTHT